VLSRRFCTSPARFRQRKPEPPELPTIAWISEPVSEEEMLDSFRRGNGHYAGGGDPERASRAGNGGALLLTSSYRPPGATSKSPVLGPSAFFIRIRSGANPTDDPLIYPLRAAETEDSATTRHELSLTYSTVRSSVPMRWTTT
jgi:hypothetical protein